MFVRVSLLKKVVAEQAQKLFEDLDRLRRGAPGEYPGESHTGFEEAVELEDFEFEAKKKEEDEPADDDDFGEEKAEPKKAKKKEEPKEDGNTEEKPKQKSPKAAKAEKGLKKAQKQKLLPKSQVDPATGVKQDLDLDTLSQLATEMGYRLERAKPEEDEEDVSLDDDDLDDLSALGDDDDMDFGDLSDLGGEEDVEGEDVAVVSSDEDIGDVLGLGQEDDDLSDLEGHPLSMKQSTPVAKKSGGLKLHINK